MLAPYVYDYTLETDVLSDLRRTPVRLMDTVGCYAATFKAGIGVLVIRVGVAHLRAFFRFLFLEVSTGA